MIRANFETEPPAGWSFEEGYLHVCWTFQKAFDAFPAIMEPYAILLDGETESRERKRIMQDALAKTLARRDPMPGATP
jgi:hypothetical protein